MLSRNAVQGLSPSPTPDRFPRHTRRGAGGLKSRPEPGAHAWRGPVVWRRGPLLTGGHACAAKARRMCPPACHRHSGGGDGWLSGSNERIGCHQAAVPGFSIVIAEPEPRAPRARQRIERHERHARRARERCEPWERLNERTSNSEK